MAKICVMGASIGFILTTTYEHLLIYAKDLKYFTINVIYRKLYFVGK